MWSYRGRVKSNPLIMHRSTVDVSVDTPWTPHRGRMHTCL